ncbi:MAG: hypothetical protein AVDCRST_MAG18-916, partial [uncultured Thermomicrobiales bacterium]
GREPDHDPAASGPPLARSGLGLRALGRFARRRQSLRSPRWGAVHDDLAEQLPPVDRYPTARPRRVTLAKEGYRLPVCRADRSADPRSPARATGLPAGASRECRNHQRRSDSRLARPDRGNPLAIEPRTGHHDETRHLRPRRGAGILHRAPGHPRSPALLGAGSCDRHLRARSADRPGWAVSVADAARGVRHHRSLRWRPRYHPL